MPAHLPIGDIDSRTASKLIQSTSDLALVLDGSGTILDVVTTDPELAQRGANQWLGRPWMETVTVESREKVAAMLQEAQSEASRWRQVNHPTASGGDDLPVMYSAVRLAPAGGAAGAGRILAFGRDLRSTMQMQRRLIESQQAMERDYWRFREAETRYRNLFQTSPEAVLIVDGQAQKITEANPAAEALLSRLRPRLIGAVLSSVFSESSAAALQGLLAAARTVGRREPERLRLADDSADVLVVASLFRQEQTPFLLVRVMPLPGAAAGAEPATQAAAPELLPQRFVANARDGIVFTDVQGRVISVNRAFATLAQLSAEEQARGTMLDRWVGRTGVELGVLISNLRQHGNVGLFSTALRGELGAEVEVEISACVIASPDGPTLAFAVRDIGRRLQGEDKTPDRVSRSVGELAELVGRMPLKQIVVETTDLIERMCIETALQMTNGNRASAAQLLGLSRQSLYVKLRRFGLGGLGGDEEEAA